MNERFLNKRATTLIKAAAIILMFVHHFWGFPSWVAAGNAKFEWSLMGIDIEREIGRIGNICIGMFAFISGYAMYINRDRYRKIGYSLKK